MSASSAWRKILLSGLISVLMSLFLRRESSCGLRNLYDWTSFLPYPTGLMLYFLFREYNMFEIRISNWCLIDVPPERWILPSVDVLLLRALGLEVRDKWIKQKQECARMYSVQSHFGSWCSYDVKLSDVTFSERQQDVAIFSQLDRESVQNDSVQAHDAETQMNLAKNVNVAVGREDRRRYAVTVW